MKFKGYTLIELLVVITISIIIFGVVMAGYREFSRRQALTGILKQTKADLRLAQQLALTGQKPTGVTCLKLIGYTFIRTSASIYELRASCDNTVIVSSPIITNPVIKTIKMPVNTTISGSPVNTVTFKILGQGTDLSPVTSPLIFTIANTVAGTTGTVVVGTGGDVR